MNNNKYLETASPATIKNWDRLKIEDTSQKFTSFANKKLSQKNILPKEMFTNKNNIEFISKFVANVNGNYEIKDIIYSVGLNLLSNNPHLKKIQRMESFKTIEWIANTVFPEENDLLGIIYQALLTEGERNVKGSYFTSPNVVEQLVQDLVISSTDKILDPACGSLNFLLGIKNISPEQIYACDSDEICVLISKIKYYLAFPDTNVEPKIYLTDYLQESLYSQDVVENIRNNSFDLIITNPPWGGKSTAKDDRIKSKETYSLFLTKSYDNLSSEGKLLFLLPQSILKIKTHMDIRNFLLSQTNLLSIKTLDSKFSGVMTDSIWLITSKSGFQSNIKINKDYIPKDYFINQPNMIISIINEFEKQILHQYELLSKKNLNNSIFALGIVTGDNKNKLFSEQIVDSEPIYTGKEVSPYKLMTAKKYIIYDRKNFQQVAKDEYYRAPEKLIYKFISKKLSFSYDNQQSLVLNSANILIPKVEGLTIINVMGFLNSKLFQFVYHKIFGDMKILKGNLLNLKFPLITQEQSSEFDRIITTGKQELIDDYVFNLYNLTDNQINYILEEIN